MKYVYFFSGLATLQVMYLVFVMVLTTRRRKRDALELQRRVDAYRRQNDGYKRLLRDAFDSEDLDAMPQTIGGGELIWGKKVDPRLIDHIVFPTPFGSRYGFTVNAHCDGEAAEILVIASKERRTA